MAEPAPQRERLSTRHRRVARNRRRDRALARARRLAGRRQLPLRSRGRRGGRVRDRARRRHAIALAADVADPGAPDELFGALESHFDGPVLVLVNNAGISRDDLTPSLGDEEWDSVLQTNLTAAFRLTRRALKAMLRARSGGS